MVDEALRIATEENGYSFEGMSPQMVAIDLCDCYPWPDEIEINLEHVEKLCENWLKRHEKAR
jgi:hypothetical protein